MGKTKFFIFGILLLGAIMLFLNGCNTMEGAGRDIERGGQKLQDAAD